MFFDTVTLYLFQKDKAHQPAPGKKWIGLILLLLAIICDAFFSDSQAYCKATFKPSQNQLFLAANLYGFLLIFIFALVSG
jgi:CRISPR/Cas system-associated protein Csm6